MMPAQWATPKRAAAHFAVSQSTMYRLIADGTVPAHRFQGRRSLLVDLNAAEQALIGTATDSLDD